MKKFTSFLKEMAEGDEKKLKHLEHAEDHPINAGKEGVDHAMNNLLDVHRKLRGRDNDTKITMKYDGCLHEDTLILLSTGETKTIREIVANWSLVNTCYVVGVNINEEIVYTPVIDFLAASTQKNWIQIEGKDGSIVLTEDHQVMTDHGWVSAGDIKTGDIIRDIYSYK